MLSGGNPPSPLKAHSLGKQRGKHTGGQTKHVKIILKEKSSSLTKCILQAAYIMCQCCFPPLNRKPEHQNLQVAFLVYTEMVCLSLDFSSWAHFSYTCNSAAGASDSSPGPTTRANSNLFSRHSTCRGCKDLSLLKNFQVSNVSNTLVLW